MPLMATQEIFTSVVQNQVL